MNASRTSSLCSLLKEGSTPCRCVCPQLNRLKPGQSTVLDQGRDIPILGKIVGNRAKLETAKT